MQNFPVKIYMKGLGCTDCSLRQGAGGTKTARFGFRPCFLRYFYNRSEVYFGQKSKEHVKNIKERCICMRNTDFS